MVYQQNTMATASHVYVVCGNLWTFSLCRVVPVRDTNKRSNVSCVCYDCFSKVCLIFSSPPRQCLQANTYTGGTTLPTLPSSQLTPRQLTSPQQSDFIEIPNGGDDVQPTPPLSGYQSNSGEYCMLSIDGYVCMEVPVNGCVRMYSRMHSRYVCGCENTLEWFQGKRLLWSFHIKHTLIQYCPYNMHFIIRSDSRLIWNVLKASI